MWKQERTQEGKNNEAPVLPGMEGPNSLKMVSGNSVFPRTFSSENRGGKKERGGKF